MPRPRPLWDSAASRIKASRPCRLMRPPMDMDLKEVMEFLQTTARSVGAEISSPWFYLQFGLILAAAGIAYATQAAVHARVKVSSLAMGWPAPLRHFVRVLVDS